MKVRWDDAATSSVYPDAFEFNFSRDEIVLLLGRQRNENASPDALMCRAASRIIMNPFMAKQLANALDRVINEWGAKYGSANLDSPSPGGPGPISSSSKPIVPFGLPDLGEKADLVFQLVKGLGVEVSYERSFKMVPGRILGNRFLLGISKKGTLRNAETRILDLCSQIGMPRNLLQVFRSRLENADFIHFGLEEDQGTCLYKVYLEFLTQIRKEIDNNQDNRAPRLLHLAFKWDASEKTKQAVTSYMLYPWLSISEMVCRAEDALALKTESGPPALVADILRLVSERISPHDLLYLDVTEEGNPRRSFDINMYRAKVKVAEIYPFLGRIARRLGISYPDFHDLYEPIRNEIFGHLAGGTDRQGRNFFTVYYGTEEIAGDSKADRKKPGNAPRQSAIVAGSRPFQRIEEKNENAKHLFQLVKGIGATAAIEHSFKFLPGILLTGRFLSGVKRNRENAELDESILNLCKHIDMPPDFQERFRTELSQANFVLFGFEKNERSQVYKAYLEFTGRLAEAVEQEPRPESVVIYTGFKWNISEPSKKVLAEYHALPLFRASDIAARISAQYYPGEVKSPFRIIDDFVDLAGSRSHPGELLYLEVTEQDNVRSSFDLNMYFADLTVAELYPFLIDMARHYAIGLKEFEERYQAVKTQKFGHISGGRDREGRDFITMYFSKKGSSRSKWRV